VEGVEPEAPEDDCPEGLVGSEREYCEGEELAGTPYLLRRPRPLLISFT